MDIDTTQMCKNYEGNKDKWICGFLITEITLALACGTIILADAYPQNGPLKIKFGRPIFLE